MNLLGITNFVIDRDVARASVAAIQRAGQRGRELFVAWSGVIDEQKFRFRRATIPAQTSHRTRHGLLVTIDGDSLFQLNRGCHDNGEILAGQVHAHPEEAYHSPADDELAIVTVPGGLSFVIPDFARGGMDAVATWACFQLDADGAWDLPPASVQITIE